MTPPPSLLPHLVTRWIDDAAGDDDLAGRVHDGCATLDELTAVLVLVRRGVDDRTWQVFAGALKACNNQSPAIEARITAVLAAAVATTETPRVPTPGPTPARGLWAWVARSAGATMPHRLGGRRFA